ncbi:MAG: glycosyltransferase [Bacteroidales bacterium]
MLVVVVFFWLAVTLVFHTYIFFPVLLSILYRIKSKSLPTQPQTIPLMQVSILIAAHNEEAVIEQKIESIFQSNYPHELLEVWVGSDNSTDKTNAILQKLKQKYPQQLHPVFFNERNGKINIINKLAQKASSEILIITDANVIFDKNTIGQLCLSILDKSVGLVDTRMIHSGLTDDGISKQENFYISNEVKIKYYEGQLWGTMMGPFGGCYAVKKSLFKPVPENFLVDDFFINMQVLAQGYKAINNPQAIVVEDVSNNLKHEFKRKIRIATGNFQNLRYFLSFTIKNLFKPVGFCFLSHKIIRWFTPIIMLFAFLALTVLAINNISFYYFLFLVTLGLIIIVLFERLLSQFNINIKILRLTTHFFYMNLALLIGFFRFLKGVKSSIWTPTPRFQSEK